MTTVENQYLVGNFAPVNDEVTVTDLPVEGAIPPEINGRYLRNGPNPIAPDPAAYHWFTGDGMLHAIELRDGKAVSYRNRWVRTDQALDLLGEDAIPGQPDDVFPVGSSAANTHVVAHAGKIFALVEVCLPTQVRPDLSTVGRYDFGGTLRSAMTAHPKIDPVTGEMLFFGYDPFGPPWLRFHVVDAAGELVRSEDIDLRGPSMVHDFAITERNVVFLDLPVVFDFDLVGKRPFPAAWKPDYGARVGVMPRDGGNADVRWFDVELCYVFHPLNAYDENGERGARRRPASEDVRHGHLRAGRAAADPRPVDHRPRRRQGHRGAPRRPAPGVPTGRRARSSDGSTVSGTPRSSASTTKASTSAACSSTTYEPAPWTRKTFGPGTHAGEGVFVPASPTAGEDEGWVLSIVYDDGRRRERSRDPRCAPVRRGRTGPPTPTRPLRLPRLVGSGRRRLGDPIAGRECRRSGRRARRARFRRLRWPASTTLTSSGRAWRRFTC